MVELIAKGDDSIIEASTVINALKYFGKFGYFDEVVAMLIDQFTNRKAYVSLVDGCQLYEDSHISKYLFNDYIMLDICLSIGPPISYTSDVIKRIMIHGHGLQAYSYKNKL